MKSIILFIEMLCLTFPAAAGFKPKIVKSKKPNQFRSQTEIAGVTFAADLLLEGKDQKDFFYKELTSCNVIAVRLAIFNNSKGEVALPPGDIRLVGPNGEEIPAVAPEVVAQAMVRGLAVNSKTGQAPVQVGPNTQTVDPRIDRTDPRYDPRLDPSDPRYDPSDPRNTGYGRPPYSNDPLYRPGVQVILNPSGNKQGNLSGQLIEKDFIDKAHSADPVPPSMIRDKFLYFSLSNRPASSKGFMLRLPQGKGLPQGISLKF